MQDDSNSRRASDSFGGDFKQRLLGDANDFHRCVLITIA
jgi:hypothetical protein